VPAIGATYPANVGERYDNGDRHNENTEDFPNSWFDVLFIREHQNVQRFTIGKSRTRS
jgi:hypothetical protein